jgi:hypothetical protein
MFFLLFLFFFGCTTWLTYSLVRSFFSLYLVAIVVQVDFKIWEVKLSKHMFFLLFFFFLGAWHDWHTPLCVLFSGANFVLPGILVRNPVNHAVQYVRRVNINQQWIQNFVTIAPRDDTGVKRVLNVHNFVRTSAKHAWQVYLWPKKEPSVVKIVKIALLDVSARLTEDHAWPTAKSVDQAITTDWKHKPLNRLACPAPWEGMPMNLAFHQPHLVVKRVQLAGLGTKWETASSIDANCVLQV